MYFDMACNGTLPAVVTSAKIYLTMVTRVLTVRRWLRALNLPNHGKTRPHRPRPFLTTLIYKSSRYP